MARITRLGLSGYARPIQAFIAKEAAARAFVTRLGPSGYARPKRAFVAVAGALPRKFEGLRRNVGKMMR